MGTGGDNSSTADKNSLKLSAKAALAQLLQESWRLNSADSYIRIKKATDRSLIEDGPGTVLTVAEHILPRLRRENWYKIDNDLTQF